MKRTEKKKRIWMPIKKATTFRDKRAKRNRTRIAQTRSAIKGSA